MPCDLRSALSLFAFVTVTTACTAPPLEAFCPIPEHGTPAERLAAVCACQTSQGEQYYPARVRSKLDILFVVSNAPGMAAKQQALAESYAFLTSNLDSSDLDYHLGVISTDVGSWTAADTPFATSAGSCDSFAGDDGRLQATSCLDRPGLSPQAQAACQAVCRDRKFVPNNGLPYLSRHFGNTNAPKVLEPDHRTGKIVDRGPEYALKCMTVLGDSGCAVSSPLESARRALDGHLRANSGFRRDGVPLVVIFFTDSDDCSVQPARRSENDPRTQDCPNPDPNAPASCYRPGPYRCLARDVACNEPLNTPGPKTNCHERPDSPLEPVDTYIQFFAQLGHAPWLYFIGIWPLPDIPTTGPLVVSQDANIAGSPGLRFGTGPTTGCQSPSPDLGPGNAQLRLSRFARPFQLPNRPSWRLEARSQSICDPTQYAQPFGRLMDSIGRKIGPACLPVDPKIGPDGLPLCLIGDVPENNNLSIPDQLMPLCGPGCCQAMSASPYPYTPSLDPSIVAACLPEPSDCYCLFRNNGFCEGWWEVDASISVWRKDNGDPPPNRFTTIRCAAQCAASSSSY